MDEESIRRIVREEIRAAFDVLAKEADALDGYDSDHIESVALSAVQRSAEYASSTMGHDPTCASRTERWGTCNCGEWER
jgi:hypothetical protein